MGVRGVKQAWKRPWLKITALVKENERTCGLVLVLLASRCLTMGLSQSLGSPTAPLGEFPFPVSSPVPGPGPQVRGREVFLTPTTTPPLSSASRGVKRVGCTFPYLRTKQLCVALPWSCPSQPTMGWRKWGGLLSPRVEKAEVAAPLCFMLGSKGRGGGVAGVGGTGCVYRALFLPPYLGVCFISHPCDLQIGPLVAGALIHLVWCHICVRPPGRGLEESAPQGIRPRDAHSCQQRGLGPGLSLCLLAVRAIEAEGSPPCREYHSPQDACASTLVVPCAIYSRDDGDQLLSVSSWRLNQRKWAWTAAGGGI